MPSISHGYFRAENLRTVCPRFNECAGGRALDEEQHRKIIGILKASPNGLTIEEIARQLELSRITAAKYLNSLLVSGRLSMRKAGPAKIYSLSARLPARDIVARLPYLILVLDESYTVREVSDSFLDTFRVSRDDLVGNDIMTTPTGPGLIERIRDPVRRAMAGREEIVESWVPVQKEWHMFRIRVVPLVFDWGGTGVTVMLEDQTGEVMAREENTLLAELLNDSPAAVTVLDFEGRYLYSNRRNLELHGYTAGEFLKLNISDLDIPEERSRITDRMKRLREAGEMTFIIIHADRAGRPIPLEVHAKVARWGDREVIISIATDITERQAAEQALRESEETFRALVEQSVEGTVIVDFSGNVLFANRQALEIVECPLELRMTSTFNIYDVVSRELQENAIHDLEQVSRGIDSYEVFYKILTLEQNEKWVACIGKKIAFRGAPAILISFRDVTGRKLAEEALRESEQKFSTLFTNNPVPLTLASAQNGEFVDVNDSFLHDTGYSRREVIGRTATELGLFTSPAAYGEMVSRLRSRRQVQSWEMECRIKSGEVRTCLFSSRIILMAGRPHIISTIENITERKAAESAFQTMVSSMIGASGRESLDRITRNLAAWLKADCVVIGRILPGCEQAQALSMVLDGKKIPEYSYSLRGSPCDDTARKGFCVYENDVAERFPDSQDLKKFGIHGYAGTPLRNFSGDVVGIICIMTRGPLILPPSAREIIDMIAIKAASEMESGDTGKCPGRETGKMADPSPEEHAPAGKQKKPAAGKTGKRSGKKR